MVLCSHKWLLKFAVVGVMVCCGWQVQAQTQEQEGEQNEQSPILSTPLPSFTPSSQPEIEIEGEPAPDLPALLSEPIPAPEAELEPEVQSVPEVVTSPTPIIPEQPLVPEVAPRVEIVPQPLAQPESQSQPDLPATQSEPLSAPVAQQAPEPDSTPEVPLAPTLELTPESTPVITPPILSHPAINEEPIPNAQGEISLEDSSPRLAPIAPPVISPVPSLEPVAPVSPLSPPAPINSDLPRDLSPYGMFMQADIIVQSVMVLLLAASLLTWVIWLAKSVEIFMAKRRARQAVKSLISSRSLAEAIEKAQGKKGITARLIMAAAGEVRLSLGAVDGAGSEGMKERVASHLARIEVRSSRVIARGTGVLATIGAVAPFVGLFGTVWGIINAFIGISQAQTTNLAVVAPGIAEALLATAMGLFAAIPAVVIYNVFARSITGYRQMLADISAAIERLISRDLDFRLAHKKASQSVSETVGE